MPPAGPQSYSPPMDLCQAAAGCGSTIIAGPQSSSPPMDLCQAAAGCGSTIIFAAHGSLPSRLPAAALRSSFACPQLSSAPKCTAACLQRLYDNLRWPCNYLRRPNVQPPACSCSPIIFAAHGSLPSRSRLRLSNNLRRLWIFAKPQQAAALR
jgi:hypothetical protein